MNKKTILIVEDDSGINLLLQKKIRDIGYAAVGCININDALIWCMINEPLFILLDYHLGNTDAIELINMLKEKGKNYYFVVLTGHNDYKIAVEMMKLGALDFIIKEINFISQMPAIINRIIRNIETKEELRLLQGKIIKSEEKYRTIFENILDIYFECSNDGKILEISPSVERILKYKRNDLLGTSIRNWISNTDEVKKIRTQFETQKCYDDFEVLVKDALGELRCCSVTSHIINDIFVGTLRDISERKKLEIKLLNAILETEERERKRFSEDLHDGLGPLLSSVKLNINRLQKEKLETMDRNEIIKFTSKLIDEAISDSRNIANNLTPIVLNDFGLVDAIKAFIKSVKSASGIEIKFVCNLNTRLRLIVEIMLYRIIQELINNTLKHADAKNITIALKDDVNLLSMVYTDDGKGFDYEKMLKSDSYNGLGLKNIMNKTKTINAYYSFDSKPGKGVKVSIKFVSDKLSGFSC
ncbi:MAG: PAS domain S-box protein [Bacteroidia bacterium]|nr:PAS domain S-box protein [Bacteroidia bacterium]